MLGPYLDVGAIGLIWVSSQSGARWIITQVQMFMDVVSETALVKAAHQAAATGGPMIDQVPDIPEGEPFAKEWRTFKREVYRLVSEGQSGRFVVFRGDQLVGVWDTLAQAAQAGRQQCGGEPFLIQEIQLYLRSMRWGYARPCPD
jgi:hypothetical protein